MVGVTEVSTYFSLFGYMLWMYIYLGFRDYQYRFFMLLFNRFIIWVMNLSVYIAEV